VSRSHSIELVLLAVEIHDDAQRLFYLLTEFDLPGHDLPPAAATGPLPLPRALRQTAATLYSNRT